MQSSFVGEALSEKKKKNNNNHTVSIPSEYAWLQLNQGEKHLKYPSPASSMVFWASHAFFFGIQRIHWNVFYS